VNQTYDPILEIVELRRVRLGALPPPAMGTALVLERPVGAPLVVPAGDRVPDPRKGNYRRMFRIDIANRGLSFTTTVPSENSAFPFSVEISFACQVVDPAAIARDNVRDMTAALTPSLTSIVRRVAGHFHALKTGPAEAAITGQLMTARSESAVRLSGFAVRVGTVDAGHLVSAERDAVVLERRRRAMEPVVQGGRDAMLAHTMAMNGGDPTAWLDREQEAKENNTTASLRALAVLMGSSEQLEGFNKTEISNKAMSTFFGSDGSPIGPQRGIRERIERKRLSAGDDGGSPVVEGTPVDTSAGTPTPDPGTADKSGGQPDNNGRRSSRIRGSASGALHTDDA
jgi:hypothetical protein